MTPLDEEDFDWLFDQVGSVPDESSPHTYVRMLEALFFKEFLWIIPNDDNRAEDGRDLRHEFVNAKKIKNPDHDWMYLGCSMLEMFVGVARRLAFFTEGEARDWFWVLIRNVGLDMYPDSKRFTRRTKEAINEILDDVIWRTYHSNGRGGLFPLEDPEQDQRDVELWYQMSAYLLERDAA